MQEFFCAPSKIGDRASGTEVKPSDAERSEPVATVSEKPGTYSAVVCNDGSMASPPSSPNTGYQTVEVDRNKR